MWLRWSVRLLTLAGVLAMVAWACGSETGPRDINYGKDVGAGYTGPEVGLADAVPDAGMELSSDFVPGTG